MSISSSSQRIGNYRFGSSDIPSREQVAEVQRRVLTVEIRLAVEELNGGSFPETLEEYLNVFAMFGIETHLMPRKYLCEPCWPWFEDSDKFVLPYPFSDEEFALWMPHEAYEAVQYHDARRPFVYDPALASPHDLASLAQMVHGPARLTARASALYDLYHLRRHYNRTNVREYLDVDEEGDE